MGLEALDLVEVGDVGGDRDDIAGTGGELGDGLAGAIEGLAGKVGQCDLHAAPRAELGGGQADAAGRAGDHGDGAGLQDGVEVHGDLQGGGEGMLAAAEGLRLPVWRYLEGRPTP